jgi:hypothetical protein
MGGVARTAAEQRYSLPAMVAAYGGLYRRRLTAAGRCEQQGG